MRGIKIGQVSHRNETERRHVSKWIHESDVTCHAENQNQNQNQNQTKQKIANSLFGNSLIRLPISTPFQCPFNFQVEFGRPIHFNHREMIL